MFQWNKQKEGRLRNLYNAGMPINEIRFQLKCNYPTLRSKIAELGLKREGGKGKCNYR